MVELQIVVLVVAGSSPVGHPSHKSQIPSSNAEQALLLMLFRLLLLASIVALGIDGLARSVLRHIAHGPDRRFVWPIAVSPGGLQLLGAHSQ